MAEITQKTEITTEQIVADFGDYYKDSGQGEQNLHMLPMEEFGTQEAFTTIDSEDTVLDNANVEVTELLQQYQDKFTPKGSVGFTPVRIILNKVKIDTLFNPHKVQKSYLGFLAGKGVDVTEWPFPRWIMEKYIMGQIKQDLEMKAIYTGVHAEPEEGVAGDASKTMDGVEKVQNDLITAGKLAPIVLGDLTGLTDLQLVDKIELFVQTIPELYRYMDMQLNMSRTLRDRFNRGMRAKYKMNYAPGDINASAVADFENIKVVGRASQQNKQRVWCTPKYNALFGVKSFGNTTGLKMETALRDVAVFGEFFIGCGFVQPKMLFVSDGETA